MSAGSGASIGGGDGTNSTPGSRSRGRSRLPYSKSEAKWQSSDTNMPGPKPKLGTMGRQLSSAT